MKLTTDLEITAAELLASRNLRLLSCTPLQTLWAGYGHIARVTATCTRPDTTTTNSTSRQNPQTYILKHVSPPPAAPARKTSRSKVPAAIDEGHIRKLLSYQVEQYFYTRLALRIPSDVAVASCLAASHPHSSASTAMLMTDLRVSFPVAGERVVELTPVQVHAALDWLGAFHGFWWEEAQRGEMRREECVRPPLEHFAEHGSAVIENGSDRGSGGVWMKGGYSHLATRRKEYNELRVNGDSEWSALCEPVELEERSIAELVDAFLYPASESVSSSAYQTLIHGDVKSENLFTSVDGSRVAFYDFQYVGLGMGVSDLAKLFTVSIPLRMLVEDEGDVYDVDGLQMGQGEKMLLERYLREVESRSERTYKWEVFVRHWETALVDWLRFQASWGFWGNTEWLEARVRSILADKKWLEWLKDAVRTEDGTKGTTCLEC